MIGADFAESNVHQCWLNCIDDAEGKRLVAFSSDREDNVQQAFDRASIFQMPQYSIYVGKGDPHHKSASAKDISRERALDRTLDDPPPISPWLATEERRTSRVDVNVRYLPMMTALRFL